MSSSPKWSHRSYSQAVRGSTSAPSHPAGNQPSPGHPAKANAQGPHQESTLDVLLSVRSTEPGGAQHEDDELEDLLAELEGQGDFEDIEPNQRLRDTSAAQFYVRDEVKLEIPSRAQRPSDLLPYAQSKHTMPPLRYYNRFAPYTAQPLLRDTLAQAAYCAKVSKFALKDCHKPSNKTLSAHGLSGITTKPCEDRLEKILIDFYNMLGSEPTGDLTQTFVNSDTSTKGWLRHAESTEYVFSHHLYHACHCVITGVLGLKKLGVLAANECVVFERSPGQNLVVEVKSPTAVGQQSLIIDLCLDIDGDDYVEGFVQVTSAAQANEPVRLYAATAQSPTSEPTTSSEVDSESDKSTQQQSIEPVQVLKVTEPLSLSFARHLAHVGERLFEPIQTHARLRPAPFLVTINGGSFWVAFRVGEKRMEITRLYKCSGNIRFLMVCCALPWALSVNHPALRD